MLAAVGSDAQFAQTTTPPNWAFSEGLTAKPRAANVNVTRRFRRIENPLLCDHAPAHRYFFRDSFQAARSNRPSRRAARLSVLRPGIEAIHFARILETFRSGLRQAGVLRGH